jgi:hypothetical protein
MPSDRERRRRAIDAILGAEPMADPWDPGEIRRELDEARTT